MKTQRMNRTHLRFPVLAVAACLLAAPVLLAQSEEESQIHGFITFGVQGLAGDHSSAQFNEYRDIHPGLFIQSSGFSADHIWGTQSSVVCQSRYWVRNDSSYHCQAAQDGKYSLEFTWDNIPHVFTNSATTLFNETAPGVFSVPFTTRQLLQSTPTAITTVLTGNDPIDMSIERQRGGGVFTWTPTAHWLFQLLYSHESQRGFRPLGTTTNDETNQLELPEPIKYSVHEMKAVAQYAGSRGAIEASFTDSLFHNEIKQLVWDNPFNTTNALSNGAGGRMALYPDNDAQTFDLAGAYNISHIGRLMGSISPGWERQNDAFLPETTNTAITGVPALPASSLHGDKQTLAMNYTLTSHPLQSVELTATYRSFDYSNNTPALLFTNFVFTDYRLDNLERESQPYGYSSEDAIGQAVWTFRKNQSIKAGYQFEEIDRQHRDVPRSDENTGYVGLNLNPRKWISVTGTYKHGVRQPSNYALNLDTYPAGGNRQFALMQRFDEAARDRDQADVLLQIDAGQRLSFYGDFNTLQDRYPESSYGMLNFRNLSESGGFTYALMDHVTLFGDYTVERDWSDMQARQRSSTNDSPNNDWQTRTSDNVNTGGGGLSFSLLSDKLALDTYYDLSFAKGNQLNRALGTPGVTGFLVTAIQNYPETSNRFGTFTADLRYHMRNNVTPHLQYSYETFGNIDFQTSPMMPYMSNFDTRSLTSIYLGATLPGYAVHIVSASIEYRF